MIYSVIPYPVVNYYTRVNNLEKGKDTEIEKSRVFIGDGGIHTSVMLGNLGYMNMTVGFIPDDVGRFIEEALTENGCSTGFIKVKGNGSDCVSIMLDGVKPTNLIGKGISVNKKDIEHLYGKLDFLTKGDTLILTGKIPSGFPKDYYTDILKTFGDREIDIVIDTEDDSFKELLTYSPFLVRTDREGIEKYFETTLKDASSAAWYAGKLVEEGAQNVIVYLGAEGTVLVSKDGKAFHSPAPKGNVVNTIGARESLVAGFLAGYFDSEGDLYYAFNMGLAASNATAFTEGIATAEKVRSLM